MTTCPRALARLRKRMGVVVLAVLAGLAASATPAAAVHGVVPVDLRTTWPCEPVAIFVDPAAPATVHDAVAEWHRLFRPDWTFTTEIEEAAVEVWMRVPDAEHVAGLATVWATATTRLRGVVEIDPRPGVDHGDTARHELGHVAGLEHNHGTQWSAMAARPLLHRFHPVDMVGLAVARRHCR